MSLQFQILLVGFTGNKTNSIYKEYDVQQRAHRHIPLSDIACRPGKLPGLRDSPGSPFCRKGTDTASDPVSPTLVAAMVRSHVSSFLSGLAKTQKFHRHQAISHACRLCLKKGRLRPSSLPETPTPSGELISLGCRHLCE